MRDTEHFKNHMQIVTESKVGGVHQNDRRETPIEDPFHHTRFTIELGLWDWLKLLFSRRREIEVRVHVMADGCAIGRWFQGADICERCCRERIDLPGQHPTKPGYESCGQRICQACYYEYPVQAVGNATDAQSAKDPTP